MGATTVRAVAAPTRGRAGRAIGLVAVVGLLGASILVRAFVHPPSDTPGPTDAVVVLSGSVARLAAGLDLVRQGLAPTLVVSNGERSVLARERDLCTEPQEFEVVCFRPPRQSTAGEARAIGRMAEERGWTHLTVVTSTYHLTRARVYVAQCFPGGLAMVDAGVAERGPTYLRHLLREPLGVMAAVTINPACR